MEADRPRPEKRKLRDEHMQKVQDFLSLAEATVCVGYPRALRPTCAALPEVGRSSPSAAQRAPTASLRERAEGYFLEHQRVALAAMYRMQRDLCAEVRTLRLCRQSRWKRKVEACGKDMESWVAIRPRTGPRTGRGASIQEGDHLLSGSDSACCCGCCAPVRGSPSPVTVKEMQ